jgi:hypothetical protein
MQMQYQARVRSYANDSSHYLHFVLRRYQVRVHARRLDADYVQDMPATAPVSSNCYGRLED